MAELDPTDLITLIDRYLEQQIDEQGHRRLSRRLEQSASDRALFVRMSTAHRCYHEWARFETEMNASEVALPDLDESRRIDDEVWQSLLHDSIRARQRADLELKAQQMLEENQRLEQHRQAIEQRERMRRDTAAPRTIVIPRSLVWSAAAAVVLLSTLLLLQFAGQSAPSQPTAQPPAPTDSVPAHPVASLAESKNAAWSERHLSPGPGSEMLPGRYRLERGAVGVELQVGTSLVIQAPCDFELVGTNRLRLVSGRLFANVPPQATGFTVQAGGVEVVDLGTGFGVGMDEQGQLLTSVMKGTVELRSSNKQEPVLSLKRGESVTVRSGGSLAQAVKTTDPNALASFAQTVQDAADPHVVYRQAVLADKPLLYWDFEAVTAEGIIENATGSGSFGGRVRGPVGLSPGQIGKAGRFNGDPAVQSDVVSVDPLFADDPPAAYTVLAWVRMDRIQKSSIAAFFQRDDSGRAEHKHGMHLDLDGQGTTGDRSAKLRFIHRAPLGQQRPSDHSIYGDLTMRPDRWVLLAAVKDAGEVRVYADARLIMSADNTQGVDGPVRLAIGSPGVGLEANRSDFRTFAGQIDEVAVFDYALGLEQLNRYYNLGQAQQP